jgi:hypothetical protein
VGTKDRRSRKRESHYLFIFPAPRTYFVFFLHDISGSAYWRGKESPMRLIKMGRDQILLHYSNVSCEAEAEMSWT